ncbi:MAG TPA: lysylphosphatidylglycerol synthase transmembrane domain-containing protein, partial [Bdellovibrionota bacterium]|nr:lysylphosphatidylglycerol synthase transmembrane domain-containing protein [Bdellovibrionota bacterium]
MSEATTLENPQLSLETSRSRSKLTLALKALAVFALLGALGYKGLISLEKTKQALFDWEHMALAVGVSAVALALGMMRWQWLLRAQDIHLPFFRTIQLTLIGNFFNVALPGAVSGDLVKAFYIGKEVEGKRARAFGAILFDRVVGVSALVIVSAGALAAGLGTFSGALIHGIRLMMLLAAAGVIGFYVYLFVVR